MIFGGSVTTFPKMKPSIDLKNDIQKLTLTEKIESTVYDTTGLIGPTTANQQC